jgi:hypothetical protein
MIQNQYGYATNRIAAGTNGTQLLLPCQGAAVAAVCMVRYCVLTMMKNTSEKRSRSRIFKMMLGGLLISFFIALPVVSA